MIYAFFLRLDIYFYRKLASIKDARKEKIIISYYEVRKWVN